jgi:hypothetical protein
MIIFKKRVLSVVTHCHLARQYQPTFWCKLLHSSPNLNGQKVTPQCWCLSIKLHCITYLKYRNKVILSLVLNVTLQKYLYNNHDLKNCFSPWNCLYAIENNSFTRITIFFPVFLLLLRMSKVMSLYMFIVQEMVNVWKVYLLCTVLLVAEWVNISKLLCLCLW